jgi:hypothetical protein
MAAKVWWAGRDESGISDGSELEFLDSSVQFHKSHLIPI